MMNTILIIIGEYIAIHFLIGAIRGLLKWNWVRNNVYDYYDKMKLNYVEKMFHHINRMFFKKETFIIAAVITLIIITMFYLD